MKDKKRESSTNSNLVTKNKDSSQQSFPMDLKK